MSGIPDDLTIVSPKELPDCDVLELDCEGSELSILQSLSIRPQLIFIEIHPHKGGFGPYAVLEELDQLGYDIVRRYTHDGQVLSHEELLQRLEERVDTKGEGLPPVVVAEQ